jgi:hypothetical protein
VGSRGPLPDRRLAVLKGDGRVRDFSRAVTAAPDKPDHLGEVAAKVWDDVGPELERLGCCPASMAGCWRRLAGRTNCGLPTMAGGGIPR